MKNITLIVTSVVLGTFLPDQVQAQPWSYANTGISHTIVIPTSIVPTADGVPLTAGDYIGVFFDRSGAWVCGGYEMWNGTSNISVAAFGDDPLTPTKDGFASGEQFRWAVWRHTDSKSGSAAVDYMPVGGIVTNTDTYATGGISILTSLAATITPTYTINTSANPPAGGTTAGGGSYGQGATAVVTASPNLGYTFLNWTENGTQVSTSTTYSFTVSGSRTLVANFTLLTYTISTSSSPAGGGTTSGGGSYSYGQTVSVIAASNSGYTFSGWTEGGTQVSTNATYSFTATSDRTLVANFTANSYLISTSANPTSGGSTSGGGTYSYGQSTSVTATPNAGYVFVNWTEGGTPVSTSATYSFTVTGGRTLVANFQLSQYTISTTANPTGGGTLTGGGTYTYGQGVTVTASPNTGYTFVNWTEGGTVVSTSTTYGFTASANRTLVANFSAITYAIDITSNPPAGGTTTGAGNYPFMTWISLTATPSVGYTFVNWTEGGTQVSTASTYSFQVPGNRSLVANFQLRQYTISTSSNPAGGGSTSGGGTYTHGQSVTVSATPNSGYTFINWTESGTQVSASLSYTFTAGSSRTLVANFQAPQYSISTSTNPPGAGTTSGGGSYGQGETATVTASPGTGYDFLRWTENGTQVSTDASYSFTVTGSRTLVANFQLKQYDITTSANPASGGNTSGDGTYPHGQSVAVSAYANTGYAFVNWTEGGTQISANATYTFTATAHRTLVANFSANSYSISTSANPPAGGSTSGGGTYAYGQTAIVVATPNTGYEFVDWTEGGIQVSTNATYTITVAGPRSLVANFQLRQYAISATVKPIGGGSVTGAGRYTHGASVSLAASASPGYSFVNWTEGGLQVSGSATYTFSATGDRALVATFVGITYTITTSAEPPAGGSISGGGDYAQGQTVIVTAVPNAGYTFVNWTENGLEVSASAGFSFPATTNRTLVAHFSVIQYQISASVNPPGAGTISGGGTSTYGQTITLVATAKAPYVFSDWAENGVSVSTNSTYTFVVAGSRSLVANFVGDTCVIALSADPPGGGTIAGGGRYAKGQAATVTAIPNAAYAFTAWTEQGIPISTQAIYSFTVSGNKALVAMFQLRVYSIVTTSNPGTGGTTSGSGSYSQGQSVTVSASANAGYVFANWTEFGTPVSASSTFTFTARASRSLVANFAVASYVINTSANPSAGGTTFGAGTYFHNQTVSVMAVPSTGFKFIAWTENGTQVCATPFYAFTATGPRDLLAAFSPVTSVDIERPLTFALDQNYPNPFNPATAIQFTIASARRTVMRILDPLGREVTTLVNEVKERGIYTVTFDATNLPSGVYYCRLQAEDFVATRKLVLVR